MNFLEYCKFAAFVGTNVLSTDKGDSGCRAEQTDGAGSGEFVQYHPFENHFNRHTGLWSLKS